MEVLELGTQQEVEVPDMEVALLKATLGQNRIETGKYKYWCLNPCEGIAREKMNKKIRTLHWDSSDLWAGVMLGMVGMMMATQRTLVLDTFSSEQEIFHPTTN